MEFLYLHHLFFKKVFKTKIMKLVHFSIKIIKIFLMEFVKIS